MKILLCQHSNSIDVGTSVEGLGSLIIYWCPNCGAIKRTMTNWKYTDYPWVKPSNKVKKTAKIEKRVARVLNGPDTTFGD